MGCSCFLGCVPGSPDGGSFGGSFGKQTLLPVKTLPFRSKAPPFPPEKKQGFPPKDLPQTTPPPSQRPAGGVIDSRTRASGQNIPLPVQIPPFSSKSSLFNQKSQPHEDPLKTHLCFKRFSFKKKVSQHRRVMGQGQAGGGSDATYLYGLGLCVYVVMYIRPRGGRLRL